MDASRVQVVIEPNRALTWRESLVFFAATALLSLAVGLLFALQGYWLVLPFAGLELAALGVALYVVAHSCRRCQVIVITDDKVIVQKGRLQGRRPFGGPDSCYAFSRAWARVELIRSRHDWYPSRLAISASGKRVLVGEFLTEEERSELKVRLDELLTGRDSKTTAPDNKSQITIKD